METNKHIVNYALKMFLVIGGVFILAYLLDLAQYAQIRLLNALIIFFFNWHLARKYIVQERKTIYLRNLSSLVVSNFLSVFLCILGIATFIRFVDPGFLQKLNGSILWGDAPGLLEICLGLFLEGIAGSVVIAFIVMQYWKSINLD